MKKVKQIQTIDPKLERAQYVNWTVTRDVIRYLVFDVGFDLDSGKKQIDTLYLDYEELVADLNDKLPRLKIKQMSFEKFARGVTEFREFRRNEKFEQMIESLKFNPELKIDIKKELSEMLSKTLTEAEVAAIKHWLWNAKRKLLWVARNDESKRPKYEFLLNFYSSAQGIGKSEFVNLVLAKPFMDLDLVAEASVEEVQDSRFQYGVLTRKFIVFLDELDRFASLKDLNGLKRIITGKTITPRKLGTNEITDFKNSLMFVSTSNFSLEGMVGDTGSRRFFQIDLFRKLNWEKINEWSVKAHLLYQAIDESLANGYLTEELMSEQARYRRADDVELFWGEAFDDVTPTNEELKNPNHEWLTELDLDDLYTAYTWWMNNAGFKNPKNKPHFVRKLKELGLVEDSVRAWRKGKKTQILKLTKTLKIKTFEINIDSFGRVWAFNYVET